MTLRLALVGHPVAHSLSPALHHAALESVGIAGRYERLDVPDESSFDDVLEWLRQGRFDGLNVTVPHKVRAAQKADVLTKRAERVGAVNTLWCRDGVVTGDNTDVGGLIAATRQLVDSDWEPTIATVLGAGGAARSAVVAAHELGATRIRVYNRTYERALILQRSMDVPVEISADIDSALAGSELIFQATTQGMGWREESTEALELVDAATAALQGCGVGAVLVDLVYSPPDTPWVRAARALELVSDSGIEMLVRQAAEAFGVWTGRRPSLLAMRDAV